MMNLLIYSDQYEPITKLLLDHKNKLNLTHLWIKDLLDKGEIFDQFDEKETKIQWFIPGTGNISNSNEIFVINRVLFLPKEWFAYFCKKDRQYANHEFLAYLTFALNAFPRITERPNAGSLSGGCFSLTAQWKTVKSHCSENISTPTFYIGPYDLLPKEWKHRAIFTHPYNFYFWKINEFKEEEKDNLFVIKKPSGLPLLAFVVDEDVNFYMEQGMILKESFSELIKLDCIKIHKLFGFFISEILLFVEHNQCVFLMISNIPYGSLHLEEFKKNIYKKI